MGKTQGQQWAEGRKALAFRYRTPPLERLNALKAKGKAGRYSSWARNAGAGDNCWWVVPALAPLPELVRNVPEANWHANAEHRAGAGEPAVRMTTDGRWRGRPVNN